MVATNNKEYEMKTFKLNTKTLNEMGGLNKLIAINNLGYYGFDDAIINAMVEYEIWPDVILYRGDVYVPKEAIFGIVNTLLSNSMKLYESVDKAEQVIKQAEKELAEAVPMTEADLDAIDAGASASEIIKGKQEELALKAEDSN